MAATIDNSNATLDDIIFKDKNKAYGAYLLRKSYQKVVSTSAGMGVLLFAGALLLAVLVKALGDSNKKKNRGNSNFNGFSYTSTRKES